MTFRGLIRHAFAGISAVVAVVSFQNCSRSLSVVEASSTGALSEPPSLLQPSGPIVAGGGEKVSGTGALGVPTANGVIARIENGLQGNVSSTAGNFAKAVTQLKSNLPQVSDPTKATGYDQIQLMVYAACSDLTTGSPTKMQSVYKIDAAKTIATNRNALVAAGVAMLDQHVAGLASKGPTSVQVASALGKIVDQVAAITTNTTKIAFMSVCIAANTAGSTMLGF